MQEQAWQAHVCLPRGSLNHSSPGALCPGLTEPRGNIVHGAKGHGRHSNQQVWAWWRENLALRWQEEWGSFGSSHQINRVARCQCHVRFKGQKREAVHGVTTAWGGQQVCLWLQKQVGTKETEQSCVVRRGIAPRELPHASPFPLWMCAACQSLMPRHRPVFLNGHYYKMRSAGKSPLLINMFPAYLEIFWSQRQFAFWETASLSCLSNNSSVKHLAVVWSPLPHNGAVWVYSSANANYPKTLQLTFYRVSIYHQWVVLLISSPNPCETSQSCVISAYKSPL